MTGERGREHIQDADDTRKDHTKTIPKSVPIQSKQTDNKTTRRQQDNKARRQQGTTTTRQQDKK